MNTIIWQIFETEGKMNSALVKYLTNDYRKAMGVTRATSSLRLETNNGGSFEICDKKPCIIQPKGEGVGVINNKTKNKVEIADFENYINSLAGTKAGEGKVCDFVIAPIAGNKILLLVELTNSEKRFIDQFVQLKSGEQKQGKRGYAIEQLKHTIEKLSETGTFIDDFDRRVALFAYRLSDPLVSNKTTRRNTEAWSRSRQKFSSNISSKYLLPKGFVFEQRQYPIPFEME